MLPVTRCPDSSQWSDRLRTEHRQPLDNDNQQADQESERRVLVRQLARPQHIAVHRHAAVVTSAPSDYIDLIHHACPLQFTWSRLCGYCTLTAAYAVCSGSNPTAREYDAQTMVDIIDRNIQTGRVDQVPSATQGPAKTRMRQKIPKLHCNCHQPSSGMMIECTNCSNWFHIHCMSVTPHQLQRLSAA